MSNILHENENYSVRNEGRRRIYTASRTSHRLVGPSLEEKREGTFQCSADFETYAPNKTVPKAGAWVMIRRQMPSLEGGIDKHLTMGRVFYVEHLDSSDEEGFLPDGRYKMRCKSPWGDVDLWPYEYIVLDATFIMEAWQEKAFEFHPLELSAAQFNDIVFYCRSRGITLADAVVMALGAVTGPIGWFDPCEEVADFVSMFKHVGMGLTAENHSRRAAAKKRMSK